MSPAPAPPPLSAPAGPAAGLWQDLRYTVKLLRRHPAFATSVVLTLALAIAASTIAFSLVNGVLLKPLLDPEPDRLVGVFRVKLETLMTRSTADWLADYYSVPPSCSAISKRRLGCSQLSARTRRTTSPPGWAMRREGVGADVTSGVFRALGVAPQLGSLLTPADDRPVHRRGSC